MNTLLWIAQIVLASAFLFAGWAKLFEYRKLVRRLEEHPRIHVELPRWLTILVGILEIAGAIGVILPAVLMPASLAEDHLLIRLAAGGLALLMVAAGIYHIARKEPAAPAVTLFLLSLFVIVGRWPH
jgi:VIT1/CCC1 family predicted Fe2+/Mn2+ transporter